MKRARVPSALGIAGVRRGAERSTSGVNLFARTVMVVVFLEGKGRSGRIKYGEDDQASLGKEGESLFISLSLLPSRAKWRIACEPRNSGEKDPCIVQY